MGWLSIPRPRGWLRRRVPLLRFLRSYTAQTFRHDLNAGITVGVVVIPQGIAYAMLAELPPVYGLYAALVPLPPEALGALRFAAMPQSPVAAAFNNGTLWPSADVLQNSLIGTPGSVEVFPRGGFADGTMPTTMPSPWAVGRPPCLLTHQEDLARQVARLDHELSQ